MTEIQQTDEFRDWLVGLRDKTAKQRIAGRVQRLAFGILGDVKPVGDGLSELRIDEGPGYRVYFIQRGKVLIVLLCGGDKGSQARDMKRAKVLAREWKE